ncbi:MAG: hypothetical protein K6T59_11590 [Bryobacteraceae bacterium]|nr:hypothetical protein [Bryobacteraceae bacterium]
MIKRQRVGGRIVYRDARGRFRSRADWQAYRAEYRAIVRQRAAARIVYRDERGRFRSRADWRTYRDAYLEGWLDADLEVGDEIEYTIRYREKA